MLTSGKSYSMVGYGANRGIVPITCEQLFNHMVEQDSNPNIRFKVWGYPRPPYLLTRGSGVLFDA